MDFFLNPLYYKEDVYGVWILLHSYNKTMSFLLKIANN